MGIRWLGTRWLPYRAKAKGIASQNARYQRSGCTIRQEESQWSI